jgi:hypothetical protein
MARADADEDRQQDKRDGDLSENECPPAGPPTKLDPDAREPMASGGEPGEHARLGELLTGGRLIGSRQPGEDAEHGGEPRLADPQALGDSVECPLLAGWQCHLVLRAARFRCRAATRMASGKPEDDG